MYLQFFRTGLLVCTFAACTFAQRDLGTILGSVTDASGAAIAGAKVTITEDATGVAYNLETDTTGNYIRPLLKPGTYTVEGEAVGFKKAIQRNVLLTAGDRIVANLNLQVGEITQQVEVTAEAPLLQTESTALVSCF